MKFKKFTWFLCLISLSSCKNIKTENKAPDWSKDLSIYEIMPKQYSETKDFTGIMRDLDRLHGMFFNAICLLPVFERDEANNAYNPNSPLAISSFENIDSNLGSSEQLNLLIDSAHLRNIKVLVEWYITGTGPHHKWRVKNPKYYLSDQKMIDKHYNQDYVTLDLANKSLQKELLSSLRSFLKRNQFDGVVIYNLDRMPKAFIDDLVDLVNSIRPMLIINHSPSFLPQCHYNVNNNLYNHFEKAYAGILDVNGFNTMIDTILKNNLVNYVQDYIKNEKYGPDANVFYNAYKYYHTLTYFLPGIPWVLNGQEDPQFQTLNLFSNKPFLRKYKYNNDFYRSLNRLKQQNPALWNLDSLNIPHKISDSNEVLALERTAGKSTCVGLFNLTDHFVNYSIQKDYYYYFDVFNKAQISLAKNTELKLGPYQALLITNAL